MFTRMVSDRAELDTVLSKISLGRAGGDVVARADGRCIDLYRTCAANCKDAPSLPLMVLPGFDQAALEMHAACAVARFKQFARGQFGQRRWFCFVFRNNTFESGFRRVRATFGRQAATAYTTHAAKHGQQDVYTAVDAGEIVALLHVDDCWALVTSYAGGPTTGWVPSAYLSVRPV